MSSGLFIARLQPLHKGHLMAIEQILKENDEVIIGIGSSNESCTKRNPFSLNERMLMIEKTVQGNYKILPLEDFHNNKLWMDNIEQKIKDSNIVYTGNPLVKKLFSERGYKVRGLEFKVNISATAIRDMMYVDNDNWKTFVPEEVINVIKQINGVEKVKKVYNQYYTNLARRIENFIKRSCERFDGCVIGISGGIDSAVCAYLAVNALGADKVLGVLAPPDPDAIKVVKELGMKYETINIEPIVESYVNETGIYNDKISSGNLKSRIRMCILYGYANEQRSLVIGTGNKPECTLGYFTKYGDGGCDLLPLGNLLKREIYGLAHYLSVSKIIMNKPPSAGLWEGQTDEGELGMTYTEIDAMISGEKESSKKLKDMIKKNSHKLHMPKIFLKRK